MPVRVLVPSVFTDPRGPFRVGCIVVERSRATGEWVSIHAETVGAAIELDNNLQGGGIVILLDTACVGPRGYLSGARYPKSEPGIGPFPGVPEISFTPTLCARPCVGPGRTDAHLFACVRHGAK